MFVLFSSTCLAGSLKRGDEITGMVSYVFDGDTISLNDNRIRLQGIDCPELMQHCKKSTGEVYPCGEASTNYLKDLILLIQKHQYQ